MVGMGLRVLWFVGGGDSGGEDLKVMEGFV